MFVLNGLQLQSQYDLCVVYIGKKYIHHLIMINVYLYFFHVLLFLDYFSEIGYHYIALVSLDLIEITCFCLSSAGVKDMCANMPGYLHI